MVNSTSLPLLPDFVPHAVTQDKIVLAHVSHPLPVDDNAGPVANLFGS